MVPAVLAAILLRSAWFLVVVPIALFILLAGLGKWGPKKKVTPQQFAYELERHLLGTDGEWDWDDTTSIAIADRQLDTLRRKLSKFNLLELPERREELAAIVATLRRGEVPDVKE
ncbi:MAG TPA: hypothetical protein VLK33_02335 [Terriglobales bacterium]|nr:hypothetical protein [Terriglobales bacterium]